MNHSSSESSRGPGDAQHAARKQPQQLPVAEALVLADLCAYAEGAVVSRTLHKGQTGTMTVFAFDDGQELSEHTAPFDAYLHILDGSALLTIGGKPVIADAGCIVRMPANVPHAVQAKGRFKMALMMFREA